MNEKKFIIIGVFLAIVLGGGLWVYNAVNPNPAKPNQSSKIDPSKFKDPVLGELDAPVTLTEYFSYSCGHCKNFHDTTFKLIKKNYIDTGDIKFTAKQLFGIPHYPLAALCAAEEGKYWAFHDYLFEHSSEITAEKDLPKLKEFAKKLGLNEEKFNSCFDGLKYQDQVLYWVEEGQKLNLNSVPVFFVDDVKIEGNQSYDKFAEVIENKLKNK